MTASRLLDDIQKQADVTAYLLELLDDEELISQIVTEHELADYRWVARAAVEAYRDLLKQRLREGK